MAPLRNAPMTVLTFSRHMSPMEEAWPSTHRCMLPVGGRSLVARLLDQLRELGVRRLRIADSLQQLAARRRLCHGNEWGMTIRYSDLQGPDLRLQTLAEFGECLYLHADALHDFDLSGPSPARGLLGPDAAPSEVSSGLWVLRDSEYEFHPLAQLSGRPCQQNGIATVADYHRANLDAVSGAWTSLLAQGASIGEASSQDWQSHIASSARLGKQTYVGRHCRIGERAQLHQKCVVGHGAVIMSDVELFNVTVLPNSFVGPGVKLRDAIVTPVGTYDLEGRFYQCSDRATFGRTRHNHPGQTGLPDEALSETERRLSA